MFSSFLVVFYLCFVGTVLGASKNKPHGHQGVLQPYDGKPLPMHLTPDQLKNLDKGEPVVYNERDGKSGYGVVVQDINATNTICMDKICDLPNYNKMVPHVRSVELYDQERYANGSTRFGAKFDIGLMGLSFGYFLKLRREPKHNTLTWTLDYRSSSDFDDNVGHWQVMPHPSRSGWTRLLYSCKVKLLPWIPEFVVSFLTSKALTEATAWVKKESEQEQRRQLLLSSTTPSSVAANKADGKSGLRLPRWLNLKGGSLQTGAASTQSLQALRERVKGKIAQAERELAQHQQRRLGTGFRLRLPGKFGRL